MDGVDVHLGLDTATVHLSLSLWSPEAGLLARRSEHAGRGHAARWPGALEALLAEAGVSRHALGAIGVGVGPGSYTGVRVGIAAALGVAYGLDVTVSGGDTLAALAAGALADGETGVAVLDARRGNVYAGAYHRAGDELTPLAEPAKLPRDEVRARWPRARWLEDAPPDATHHARRARLGPSPQARYL